MDTPDYVAAVLSLSGGGRLPSPPALGPGAAPQQAGRLEVDLRRDERGLGGGGGGGGGRRRERRSGIGRPQDERGCPPSCQGSGRLASTPDLLPGCFERGPPWDSIVILPPPRFGGLQLRSPWQFECFPSTVTKIILFPPPCVTQGYWLHFAPHPAHPCSQ